MTTAILLFVLLSQPAASDTLAVLAVAEPPSGPDPDLAEMAHQLRAACRDRASGVQEPAEVRSRLLGQSAGATLPELERAYAGALAAYQNGDHEGAIRTLDAVAADLERLPESAEVHADWIRAALKLAQAQSALGRTAEATATMQKVLALDPRHALDPDQWSPGFRRKFEEARARLRAVSKRRLTVKAAGPAGEVFVNGRPLGPAPVAIALPEGTYHVAGAAGALRVPRVAVDLRGEDREVVLDFALASALRPNAGPGLAVAAPDLGGALVRAGAWLGVDRLVAVSLGRDGDAAFLVGSIYDVRRGALQREGRVRIVAGGVPPASLGALAAFLLTGQPQRDVLASPPAGGPAVAAVEKPVPRPSFAAAPPPFGLTDLAAAPAAPRTPARWMRPAAWGAATLAAVLAGVAAYEGLTARGSYADAAAMIDAGGAFVPGADSVGYEQARADGDGASRAAYATAGAAILCAATAGVLGYLSREPAAPVLRF